MYVRIGFFNSAATCSTFKNGYLLLPPPPPPHFFQQADVITSPGRRSRLVDLYRITKFPSGENAFVNAGNAKKWR
jgi:hypothetical protein